MAADKGNKNQRQPARRHHLALLPAIIRFARGRTQRVYIRVGGGITHRHRIQRSTVETGDARRSTVTRMKINDSRCDGPTRKQKNVFVVTVVFGMQLFALFSREYLVRSCTKMQIGAILN